MPYKVGPKNSKGYPIIRSDNGIVVGYSKSKKKAAASIGYREAAIANKKEGKLNKPITLKR